MITACADNKVINGTDTVPYGWIDSDENKNPNVHYKVCWQNVFWSLFFSETIIVPILLTGYELYEPESVKTPVNSNNNSQQGK